MTVYLLSSGRSGIRPANGLWSVDRLHTFSSAPSVDEMVDLYRGELDRSGPLISAGRLLIKLLGPLDGYGIEAIADQESGRPVSTVRPPGRLWRARFSSAATRALDL